MSGSSNQAAHALVEARNVGMSIELGSPVIVVISFSRAFAGLLKDHAVAVPMSGRHTLTPGPSYTTSLDSTDAAANCGNLGLIGRPCSRCRCENSPGGGSELRRGSDSARPYGPKARHFDSGPEA